MSASLISDSSENPLLFSEFMVFPTSRKKRKIRTSRRDEIISATALRNTVMFFCILSRFSSALSQKSNASIFFWTRGIGIIARQNFSPFVRPSIDP